MKKLSEMISFQRGYGTRFPVVGVDGYAGEQDGSYICFSDVYNVSKKADADRLFPDGVPDHVKVHFSTYDPGIGWNFSLGCWSDQCPEDWNWPSA